MGCVHQLTSETNPLFPLPVYYLAQLLCTPPLPSLIHPSIGKYSRDSRLPCVLSVPPAPFLSQGLACHLCHLCPPTSNSQAETAFFSTSHRSPPPPPPHPTTTQHLPSQHCRAHAHSGHHTHPSHPCPFRFLISFASAALLPCGARLPPTQPPQAAGDLPRLLVRFHVEDFSFFLQDQRRRTT